MPICYNPHCKETSKKTTPTLCLCSCFGAYYCCRECQRAHYQPEGGNHREFCTESKCWKKGREEGKRMSYHSEVIDKPDSFRLGDALHNPVVAMRATGVIGKDGVRKIEQNFNEYLIQPMICMEADHAKGVGVVKITRTGGLALLYGVSKLKDCRDTQKAKERAKEMYEQHRFHGFQLQDWSVLSDAEEMFEKMGMGESIVHGTPLKEEVLKEEVLKEEKKAKQGFNSNCSWVFGKADWDGSLQTGYSSPPRSTFRMTIAVNITIQKRGACGATVIAKGVDGEATQFRTHFFHVDDAMSLLDDTVRATSEINRIGRDLDWGFASKWNENRIYNGLVEEAVRGKHTKFEIFHDLVLLVKETKAPLAAPIVITYFGSFEGAMLEEMRNRYREGAHFPSDEVIPICPILWGKEAQPAADDGVVVQHLVEEKEEAGAEFRD